VAATLRQIAEQVGVSTSIVSRVLRDTSTALVSKETERRIRQVAVELGYRPNRYARALSVGKAPVICVVVPASDDHMLTLKAVKLHASLAELGREVVATSLSTLPPPDSTLDFALSGRPEAVVLLQPTYWLPDGLTSACQDFHARGIHALVVDLPGSPLPGTPVDSVEVDRAYGTDLGATHLLDCGHRRIALLSGEAPGRAEGYDRALSRGGVDYRCFAAVTGVNEVHQATLDLLREVPRPTAIVAGSDLLAVAVMRTLAVSGMRVPEDIAVIGFDDEPWSEFLPAPMTTVAQPIDGLCEEAVALLRARLDGSDAPWKRVAIKPTLIVRQSSGRPAAAPSAVGAGIS
jgi:DNA-binding LacI/PurR family transcriptional regulator